jgi:hypothetical protein
MRFLPGDRVKVINGTFVGKTGRAVDQEEARMLWQKAGGEEPPCTPIHGLVWVVLEIFDGSVPVLLEPSQLEHAP